MTKQERIDLEKEAEAYAEKHKNLKPSEQALVALAYMDGYRDAENEMRQKIINIFENDEEEQGKLWKTCGLKLVGWDYENNRPDEQFNFYLNLVEEAEKK